MSTGPLPALLEAYKANALSDPTNPLSLYRVAFECEEHADREGWRRAIEAALRLPHDTHQQRYCRAWAKLTLGDWSGWTEYESRAFMPVESSSRRPTLIDWLRWTHNPWDGVEDLSDKTLLVVPEQGIGDAIQMMRFLPILAERSRCVIALVYPRLVPLVQCNYGDRIVTAIDGVPKSFLFDRYVLSMSVPGLIGGLPPFEPIRRPHQRPVLPARRRRLRGGICWSGNPAHEHDAWRSMPAAFIAPLLDRRHIEWVSLQVGARAVDADAYPTLMRPWPPLVTFGDTADVLAELDVVVSVDTAVGHLAGSLGLPTYLLLSHRSDGRWGLGDRTPWYPTMRLIHQREVDDWSGVIAELQRALDELQADAPIPLKSATESVVNPGFQHA
jgi:hypothetical protein